MYEQHALKSHTNRQLQRPTVSVWSWLSGVPFHMSVSSHRCVFLPLCVCTVCLPRPTVLHSSTSDNNATQPCYVWGHVTANPVFMGNSISPTHWADLYPDTRLSLASWIVTQIEKASRGRLLQWGRVQWKIQECEAVRRWEKIVNVSISRPQWSETAPTHLLYPSLWREGNSSAYQCFCVTLNSLCADGDNREAFAFSPPLPLPTPLSSPTLQMFFQTLLLYSIKQIINSILPIPHIYLKIIPSVRQIRIGHGSNGWDTSGTRMSCRCRQANWSQSAFHTITVTYIIRLLPS